MLFYLKVMDANMLNEAQHPVVEIRTDIDLVRLLSECGYLEIHRTAGDPFMHTIELYPEAKYREGA
jgi:hypothetical protein